MALERNYPQNITPGGTNIEQGFKNDDNEIKRILGLLDSTGSVSLAGTRRQCILYCTVDSSGNPNFLATSALNVSIDGSTKPIILSFANGFSSTQGTVDILDAITGAVSNAWTIPASGTYYLYIDKDINTGLLSYGYTNLIDTYSKVAPASPVLDQHYFDLNEMKMYRYNGSTWEQKLRIFISSVTSSTDTATTNIYSLRSKADNSNIPVGTGQEYYGDIAPYGYLLCDGSAISRVAYGDLFAVLGTKFGAGDGSTTFNLPDRRSRVGVGYNSSDTSFAAIGKTGGEKTHVLTVAEMPSHNHTGWTDSQGNHAHIVNCVRDEQSDGPNAAGGGGPLTAQPSTGAAGTHGHNIGIGATGGNAAHNNMPPFIVVNYIIKY